MSALGVILLLVWLGTLLARYRNQDGGYIEEQTFSSGRLVEEPPALPTYSVAGNAEDAIYDALDAGQPPPLEGVLTPHGVPPDMQSFWVHHLALTFRVGVDDLAAEMPLSGNAWAMHAISYANLAVQAKEEDIVKICRSTAEVACGHAAALGVASLTTTARALLMVSNEDYDSASSYMMERLAQSQDVMAAVTYTAVLATVSPSHALAFAQLLAQRAAPSSGLHAALFVAHRTAVADDPRNARRTLFAHAAPLHNALQALWTWRATSPADVYVWSYVASTYALLEDAEPARAALRIVAGRFVVDAWHSGQTNPLDAFTVARETYC